MLHVLGSEDGIRFELSDEDYMALWAESPERFAAGRQPAFWRSGEEGKSIFEIGVDYVTGAVVEVKLLLLGGWVRGLHPIVPLSGVVVNGVPACDVSGFPKRRYDDVPPAIREPAAVVLAGDGDGLQIQIGGRAEIVRAYTAGAVQFGVNGDGFLRLVQVRPCPPAILERFKKLGGG
jgi:hypothetical protein